MNKHSKWFSNQLSSSAEGLAWATEQVPAERQLKRPPASLGEWSAARHIFHMQFYEEKIALPGMRIWLGEPLLPVDESDEDRSWSGRQPIEDILLRFQETRNQQIALLPKFEQADWVRVCETGWGPVSLFWVVSKTYQHTAEHISDVLRIALFWEMVAAREG